LNDEINGLLREKRHFETQIVNLGGANYKRGNASMLDDEGKEVPGTRGYKYFGRAKELPGVKEMFSKSSTFIPPHYSPYSCPFAPIQDW
jgi:pre-mRNA-splicing factor ISY1